MIERKDCYPRSILARDYLCWIIQQLNGKKVLDINSGCIINLFHLWRVSFFNHTIVDNYEERAITLGKGYYRFNYDEIAEIDEKYDFILFLDMLLNYSFEDFFDKVYSLKEKARFLIFTFSDEQLNQIEVINKIRSLGKCKTFNYKNGIMLIIDQNECYSDIYAVTHINDNQKHILGNTVIYVGPENIEGSILSDKSFDNISYLNKYINENTALYWVWKNRRTDIVGFCHYRRFFSLGFQWDNGDYKVLDQEIAASVLNDAECIVIEPTFVPESVRIGIINDVGEELYCFFENEVGKQIKSVDAKYYPYFTQIMEGYYFYPCNMFITKWDLFDKYCNWLFSIILPVCSAYEKIGKISGKQIRTLGYIAERLLTVFLEKNNIKVVDYPMLLL